MHWLRTCFFSLKDNDYPLERSRLLSYLDEHETERFNRFAFDHLKMTFATARWMLKSEIARELGGRPEDISFQYNSNGKPYLMNKQLEFSLAHTESSIVVALSNRPVGVDNELHFRRGEPWRSAESFLNKKVADDLDKLDNDAAKITSFSRYWTAMEALVKYKGGTLFQEKGEFGKNIDAMNGDGIYRSKQHVWVTKMMAHNEQLSLCTDAIPNELQFFEYSDGEFTKSDFFDDLMR